MYSPLLLIINHQKRITMKNLYQYILVVGFVLYATSCQNIVEGINENPNNITVEDVDAQFFLTGAMLANSSAQLGHLNRISGLYTGQLTGLSSLYANIYGYSLSTAESVGTWSRVYIGVVPNVRHIRNQLPEDQLMQGISKTIEAMAIGTIASLCGDVPYSQINSEDVDDPSFDNQVSVLDAAVDLLDDAIGNFGNANSRTLTEDIYFNGDADKWEAAANTLKSRYLTIMKDYTGAYAAAQLGISNAEDNAQHIPRGDASVASGDKNLFWEILEGARGGDIGSQDSYLSALLDPSSDVYRGNAKTDETARGQYSFVVAADGASNLGIIEQFEPMNIVSFEENHLTLAEAGARSVGFERGLQHLNEYRAWLASGGRLNDNFSDMPLSYEPYDAADFEAGGIENLDGISPDQALLREIIEERYVSGFGQFLPFDDARRLRSSEPSLGVPFPFNTTSATQHPERMPYSDDELNSNANAPSDPGIFSKTAVNQ